MVVNEAQAVSIIRLTFTLIPTVLPNFVIAARLGRQIMLIPLWQCREYRRTKPLLAVAFAVTKASLVVA